MPLSEHEQRILSEIEEQLLATDPALARSVGSGPGAGQRSRLIRLGSLGIVVGLIVTVVLLSVNVILSFVVGFGLMFVSGLALERGLRTPRADSARRSPKPRFNLGLKDYFSDASMRARETRHDDD